MKRLIIKIFTIILPILFIACSNNIEIPNNEENKKLENIVNNTDSYEEIVSKTYTIQDVQKIYTPYISQMVSSRWDGIEYVEEFIDVSFVRKVGGYYYTYYKTANNRIFIFFDLDGGMRATLNLSYKSLQKADFDSLNVGESSIDDVILIDPSTIVPDHYTETSNEDSLPIDYQIESEHILANGDILRIEYESKSDKLIVSEIYTSIFTVKEYFYLIMDIDK